uniref:Putative ovule protein n=1 Tax=Solanum chacoense TaxID=4108 RepID=A0A0V0IST2_SOLCH
MCLGKRKYDFLHLRNILLFLVFGALIRFLFIEQIVVICREPYLCRLFMYTTLMELLQIIKCFGFLKVLTILTDNLKWKRRIRHEV